MYNNAQNFNNHTNLTLKTRKQEIYHLNYHNASWDCLEYHIAQIEDMLSNQAMLPDRAIGPGCLLRLLCAGTISLVSFLDLFGPIAGATNYITCHYYGELSYAYLPYSRYSLMVYSGSKLGYKSVKSLPPPLFFRFTKL